MSKDQTKLLFVCMGNICRSPMAEGLFNELITNQNIQNQFLLDSAGTGAWHEGDPPDPRAIAKMKEKGVDISAQISRPLNDDDFDRFDLLLVMDEENLHNVKARSPAQYHHKIHMIMDYSFGQMIDIPDPYYDRNDGFEIVYNMLREASVSLLARLKS